MDKTEYPQKMAVAEIEEGEDDRPPQPLDAALGELALSLDTVDKGLRALYERLRPLSCREEDTDAMGPLRDMPSGNSPVVSTLHSHIGHLRTLSHRINTILNDLEV